MSNKNGMTSRHGPPFADAAAIANAQQRLHVSAYASALHDVQCKAEGDAMVLRGRVSSFYFKQLAQEVVRKADGACRIVNELEVEDRNRSATNAQANGKSHVRQTEMQGSTEATHGRSDTDRG